MPKMKCCRVQEQIMEIIENETGDIAPETGLAIAALYNAHALVETARTLLGVRDWRRPGVRDADESLHARDR